MTPDELHDALMKLQRASRATRSPESRAVFVEFYGHEPDVNLPDLSEIERETVRLERESERIEGGPTRPTPYQIAVHEAGHAVVTRLVGGIVTYISFTPDGEKYLGSCGTNTHPGEKLSSRAWAAINYAGFAAAKRVGHPSEHLHGSDLREFNCNLLTAGATREEIMKWTDEMVATHWDEIKSLADEIERHGGVYGDELVRRGFWRPPVPKPKQDSALMRALKR
jgi:hypothetical protein